MSMIIGIGSSVSAAVVAGLVSDVMWLRSSCPGCEYNGSAPGKYVARLFVTREGVVCQKILTRHSNLERDKAARIRYLEFDTCTADFDTKLREHDKPIAIFNLTVTTLPDFEEDAQLALEVVGAPVEWILDIGEDFFASYAPGRHFVAHLARHFSHRSARSLNICSINWTNLDISASTVWTYC
eukprot:gnl/TRDRNA2_/TRDRNA2_169604_c1_seq1.p1 gnl/TRDRNA2_/TRDRNA2_169604_c1~~gnl/TRDRNA2_/TRDRNA2_169604_c1_seq1.p1  ORF type:complete len:183 (-),score=14.52 gnl/TRDRNA2_/TRDRNA2_169604_c1_seq1:858-1406(-)